MDFTIGVSKITKGSHGVVELVSGLQHESWMAKRSFEVVEQVLQFHYRNLEVKLVKELHYGSLKVLELVMELHYRSPDIMRLILRSYHMDVCTHVSQWKSSLTSESSNKMGFIN